MNLLQWPGRVCNGRAGMANGNGEAAMATFFTPLAPRTLIASQAMLYGPVFIKTYAQLPFPEFSFTSNENLFFLLTP
jgi:hypothetical protein